jgi:WD40 repeat protein
VGGRRGSTLVWGLETNQIIYQNFYTMPFGGPLAPDGNSIALIVPDTTSNRGGNIYQIRNFSGSPTTIDLTETLPNANVGYAKNGTVFIAANLNISKAWDESSGNEVRVNAIDYFGCRITVSESNINDRLLGNSETGIFQPGDDDQALIDNLCPRTSRFRGIPSAFSKNLKLIAFVNANGALEGYDVSTKTTIWKYQLPDPKVITAIAISPDGSIVAMGNTSGQITFFNGETGEMLGEIVGNFGKVQAILFSDDGTKIATTGSDGIARVFGIVVTQ